MHRAIQIRATLERVPLLALALTLAGATVGIRLEAAEEMSIETAMQLVEALGAAIEARSGLSPVVDDPVWGVCRAADRCLADVRGRTGATDIVLVKLFGAPKKVRLTAQRFPLGLPPEPRFEINVPMEREAWPAPLEQAAKTMFAAGKKMERNAALPAVTASKDPAITHFPEVKEETQVAVLPWVLVGAGVAALIAGSAFGLSSRSARDDVESRPHTDAEVAALTDRLKLHGWTANVLFSVSVLSAISGGALLLLE